MLGYVAMVLAGGSVVYSVLVLKFKKNIDSIVNFRTEKISYKWAIPDSKR